MSDLEDLRKRANQGDAAAQDELARELFFKMKTQEDLDEVIMLVTKSSEAGYIPAHIDMVRFYLMGLILDENNEINCREINRLLTIAEAAGHEEAEGFREACIFYWSGNERNTPIYGYMGNTLELEFSNNQFAVLYNGGSLQLISDGAHMGGMAKDVITKIVITRAGLFKKGSFSLYNSQNELYFSAKYSNKIKLSLECMIYILRKNGINVIIA